MTTPSPIIAFSPSDPDADWETVRARLMAALAATAQPAWTDHNACDPGVTLADQAAFGIADLHYRITERLFDAWPLEVRDWEPENDRHWHATLPAGGLTEITIALQQPVDTAADLERAIRASASPGDAASLLAADPWSSRISARNRPAVVALMRSRWVRQVAQEQTHIIGAAVAAQKSAGGTVAQRDARAAAELAFVLPLWDDELRAVVRRERRRLSQEALVGALAQVRAVQDAAADGQVRSASAFEDLTGEEVDIAMAAAEQPWQRVPEDLEDENGRSAVWPPHPIQALTCEPVTSLDYARRARAADHVGRAWAVSGRLAGMAWNGIPTDTSGFPELTSDPDDAQPAQLSKAITLVVERIRDVLDTRADDEFLRTVLSVAIGPEVGAPFPDWRLDTDELTPRRLIGDEVGATLLVEAPILIQATLITGLGVDRDGVVADVRARISRFFAEGRPETWAPKPSESVDGPWPRIEQPQAGWVPGERIRFTEVVNVIVGNPEIWGVQDLAMKMEGDPGEFITTDELRIPRNAIPVLAAANCLRIQYSLSSECGDA